MRIWSSVNPSILEPCSKSFFRSVHRLARQDLRARWAARLEPKVNENMEMEVEIRDLEQIESNLDSEQTSELSDSETRSGIAGLFANGFLVG